MSVDWCEGKWKRLYQYASIGQDKAWTKLCDKQVAILRNSTEIFFCAANVYKITVLAFVAKN